MRIHQQFVAFALLLTGVMTDATASSFNREVLDVTDTNPDPDVFEASLVATEQNVMIDGQLVLAMFYKDENNPGAYPAVPDGIPVPQILVDVGEEIVIHFRNDFPANCSAEACNSSIHWHGIELDNDSDGTGVTQNRVEPGESYTYRFIAPRPGLFWFHPHMLPGPQTFAGMYGAFIVRDPAEVELQAAGVIPGDLSTHTVVLSDIEFDADPEPGQAARVGYNVEGELRSWAELKQHCESRPITDESRASCRAVQDGQFPLVNGMYTGMFEAVGIQARRGEGVRLRLINTSTNRYYRLKLLDNGNDNNLYRIGGEGGFLEFVRREGGVRGEWDTKYERGELVIPASGRADVVLVPNPPADDEDTVIILYGEGYERQGPSNMNPAEDLIFIVVSPQLVDPPFQIAEGDPILGGGAIDDLKAIDEADLDALLDPPDDPEGTGPRPGTANHEIRLDISDTGSMAINSVKGEFEDSGGDYKAVPYQGASRYAKPGDVLEMAVKNCSGSPSCTGGLHHPFHLHGFSFQPVRIIDNESGDTLYEYNYNEFQDVIDVFTGQSVVFRTRLEDRPMITDTRQEADAPVPDKYFPGGGAQGRWVYHCHLFLHAALGMISELVVVPTPVAVCQDVTVDTAPGFCAASGISINGGSFHPDGEFFSFMQDPSSGLFQLGESPASLTVTGADGLSSTCEATVTVVDNEDPTITAPSNVTDECDSIGGSDTVALGIPAVGDNCSLDAVANEAPDFFPLGNTTVYWTVRDDSNNTKTDFHSVSVIDTTNPTLTVPGDVGPIECTSADGQGINIGQATATDVCDDNVNISSDAPALFPRGVTSVTWTATDHRNNATTGTQDVTVADTTDPVISCNAVERMIPSHVVTTFTATALDSCDADVVPEVTAFDCFTIDKKGRKIDRTDGCELALRGPSIDIIDSGGVGDMIEWTVEAVDDSGNKETETCSILVVRKKDL